MLLENIKGIESGRLTVDNGDVVATSSGPPNDEFKFDLRNIEKDTKDNQSFRNVIFTGENLQLVLMALQPREEIGEEIHQSHDQFFRFDEGEGEAVLDGNKYPIKNGFSVLVKKGTKHNIINTSAAKPLKFYTLYGPPKHSPSEFEQTKQQADAREEKMGKVADEKEQEDTLTEDPLTEKGEKILAEMKKEYGEEKGEEVFYASRNRGTITGVDSAMEDGGEGSGIKGHQTLREKFQANIRKMGQNKRNQIISEAAIIHEKKRILEAIQKGGKNAETLLRQRMDKISDRKKLRAFMEALEDENFHTLSNEIYEKLKSHGSQDGGEGSGKKGHVTANPNEKIRIYDPAKSSLLEKYLHKAALANIRKNRSFTKAK